MKRLLGAAALALSMCSAASAAVIDNLGPNPTSAGGNFSNSPGLGAFDDQVLFQLVGAPQHLTIASVTNTFAGGGVDFIADFTASVYNYGVDNLFDTIDDIIVIGPVAAAACQVPNCQGMAGSAILSAGLYYASFTGTAGATAGYAGNISTFGPAPIPVPAALPLFATALTGMGLLRWKRRRTP